uniref:Uncharacterized protein n=1 Tax=Rhizophora mucronata TaxID=61149 RepID=A0A2P2N4J5_RHIMU
MVPFPLVSLQVLIFFGIFLVGLGQQNTLKSCLFFLGQKIRGVDLKLVSVFKRGLKLVSC